MTASPFSFFLSSFSSSPPSFFRPPLFPNINDNGSPPRAMAESLTPQGQAVQNGHDTCYRDRSNWASWTDTIQRIYHVASPSVYRSVEVVMRTAVQLAGSFKRQAVAVFQKRRRSLHPAPVSPTLANLRALPEDQRRRIKSHRWRRDRGHPTSEHYPFPELNRDIPQFPGAWPSIAEPTTPAREPSPISDFTADRLVPPAEPEPRNAFGEVSANRTQLSALTPPLAPWLRPTTPVEDTAALARQPPVEEHKENEPPAPEVPDYEPLVPEYLLNEEPKFLFGPPVSAVNLVRPIPLPIPPGRSEPFYAAEWKQIERERMERERAEQKIRVRIKGPAVRPLPPQWQERILDAMRLPNSKQVASTLSGDPLTRKDLASCYVQGSWLNDEVINAYLAILVDYLRRLHGNAGRHDKPLFHAFNTFFFSNLRDRGYQSVRRWASRAKIGGPGLLDVDTVFIPVHNHAHWTLAVVKPMSRTIEYFDSMGSVSKRHVDVVKTWLRGELGSEYVDEEWSVLGESPQQTNGSDCGIFLLSTAKAVAAGIDPLSYGAQDIPLLRLKVVAEVVNGGLEGDFELVEGGL